MFNFLSKNSKLIAAVGTVVALGAVNYFLRDDEEDKKLEQKQNEEKLKEEQIEKSLGMTKDEAREKMQELVKKVKKQSEESFKDAIKKDIKLEYYGQFISDKTIKIIMHRSVLLCIDSLMKVHEKLTEQRQLKYYQIIEYVASSNELIQNYFYILNISMENITQILDIPQDLFQNSLRYWQNQQKISKGYIRDLAWHFMAEAKVKTPISIERYINYLNFICEEIPKQANELKNILQQSSPQVQRIVVLSRTEDKAFFDLKISDLEAIKALSQYSQDEECKELLLKRNSLLNSLYTEQ